MAHGLSGRIVDSHIHLWTALVNPQAWIDDAMPQLQRDFEVDDLATELARHGISSAIAVQASNLFAETEWLLDASANDSIAGVVGWLEVAGDVPAQLAALDAHEHRDALRGIRHLAHVDPDPHWLRSPDVHRGLRSLGAAGLAFDFIVRSWQLDDALVAASAAPETMFVIDHVGLPSVTGDDTAWRAAITAIAALPNVAIKLSGLPSGDDRVAHSTADLRPVFDHALESFGVDRVLFGSDWPLVELTPGGYSLWLERVLELTEGLSPDQRDAIFARTTERSYGIRS